MQYTCLSQPRCGGRQVSAFLTAPQVTVVLVLAGLGSGVALPGLE